MNKKQAKILEEILEYQKNAVELLGTQQAIPNFEKIVAEKLEERVRWKVGDYIEEDRKL